MLTVPRFQDLPVQTYAYISFTVSMAEMAQPANEGFPALFSWLSANGITPTGAPFYKYNRIDMARTLEVEAGVPVDRAAAGDDTVKFSQLPAGHYVWTTHTGPYDDLYDATAMLIGWAKERGIEWDSATQSDGHHFACRLEIYETDPEQEPDPDKWVTTLRIKTTGPA
ncbi:GyrI-like domain-containing protein [Devosia sp. J2-20]|uniref:GyrI-like domain-containing protein n=1 Tax=Devosia litorisediminis TaxID=2829817 RepID=A0A942IDN7_9HYPH|nr:MULTISPECIES: GyrI-like domain-containing protein [Devosia]MBS3848470.1 GyrI-like domain-containing protein [Devosia litorisediminis]WDQ98457.1 GyrI-like domain-containing protein [Devosia sp. J2-20]